MRTLLTCLVAVLLGPLAIKNVSGQRYGSWDVPCDGGLGPHFAAPFSHGVIYQGKEFLTNWTSVLNSRPLPSLNWYAASPDRNPVSTDGTSYWDFAGVLVHCWVERNPYFITNHRDPVGYGGTVKPRRTACEEIGSGGGFGSGGTETGIAPVVSGDYDPYDSGFSGEEDCPPDDESGGSTGTGTQYEPGDYTGGETVDWGTGIGNGGTSVCGTEAFVEYVCIDVYDPETGMWEQWGCGYVTTC
ncbi:MAG TPA: hypothetical protein VFR81_08360 [Longimicrobium sp.]|nr:hypothetical protein [Longimicrobium sp.]